MILVIFCRHKVYKVNFYSCYTFLLVLIDSYNTSSHEDVQKKLDIVRKPLECSSLDENQQKHDWEGGPGWRTRRAILQDLGNVFCEVRYESVFIHQKRT